MVCQQSYCTLGNHELSLATPSALGLLLIVSQVSHMVMQGGMLSLRGQVFGLMKRIGVAKEGL